MRITNNISITILFIFTTLSLQAQKLEQLIDLSGGWQFSIGDDMQWANPDYNDSDWESIRVPDQWESQGFSGYDGFAWYRTGFYVEDEVAQMPLYLSLGYIDDVDEVYLNGTLIGRTGSFPDYFSTAYNAKRMYSIPSGLIKATGENIIAVRVFDEGGEGGIVHGMVAIMIDVEAMPVDIDFRGQWHFKANDVALVENEKWDFHNWDKIIVPGIWEDQGYKDYNGAATYAYEFNLDDEFKGQTLVLLLGRIDDFDRVYLNGNLIGSSGLFNQATSYIHSNMYRQLRAYNIPQQHLHYNGKNVLIVKVMDTGGVGGIYEGSIGLITQEHYINYWHSIRSK